jgi:hypothetical protein
MPLQDRGLQGFRYLNCLYGAMGIKIIFSQNLLALNLVMCH